MFHNVLLKIDLEHIYSEIFFSLRGKFCFSSFLMRNLKLRKSLSVDCYEGDYFFISQYFRSICQAIITQIIHYEWTCFTENHYVCKGQSNIGIDFNIFFQIWLVHSRSVCYQKSSNKRSLESIYQSKSHIHVYILKR